MAKLISSIVAIVLATATLANAAPRQSAVRKSAAAARSKTVKPSTPASRKARKVVPAKYRKTTVVSKPAPSAQNPIVRPQKLAVAENVTPPRHDLMAEEQELKRLKANIKTAQKAGDARRLSRDRREMYRLEAEVRADKADMKDDARGAKSGARKRSRIPFWGWWRS
jgi:uncharacterized protein with von Willebrand factor type A (vWA) domain